MTRTLFISPHLDDVAFSCGGLVARSARAGEQPLIVTVFASAPPGPLAPRLERLHANWGMAGLSASQVIERRRAEDTAAAALLGASTTWLAHSQATYREDRYPDPASLFADPHPADAPLAESVALELCALWQASGGARVYLPLALGDHVDHRICAAVAPRLQALGAEVWAYEDFPYALKDRAERKVPASASLQVANVSAFLEARLAAMACYRSQLAAIFRDEPAGFEAVTRRYTAATGLAEGAFGERLWQIAPDPRNPVAHVVVLADFRERFDGTRAPLAEPFGRFSTLLEAVVARLLVGQIGPVHVLARGAPPALVSALRTRGAVVLTEISAHTESEAILRGLEELGGDTAIVVDPRAAFVSPSVLRQQLALHRNEGAELTVAALVARGLGGVVVEKAALRRIAAIELRSSKANRAASFAATVQRQHAVFRTAMLRVDEQHRALVADLLPADPSDVRALSEVALEPSSEAYGPVFAHASAQVWSRWPVTPPRPREGRPKILFAHYTNSLQPGSSRSFGLAVRLWDRARFDVVAALPGRGALRDQLEPSVPVRDLAYSAVIGQPETQSGFTTEEIERCHALLRAEAPAVVFVSNPSPALATACRIAGIPIICHLKLCFWLLPVDSADANSRGVVFPSYDLVIANSRWHERHVRAWTSAPANRLSGVPNGIDLARFAPSQELDRVAARRALGLPAHAKIVLMAGMLTPDKRTVVALDVLAHLLASTPDTYLVVAGEQRGSTDVRGAIAARAHTLGVTGRVVLLGQRDDMPTVYAAADAFLHLCLIESFGLVLVEAMAMRLPVVTLASAGANDIVEDGVTGRLLPPPGDPAALARALAEVLADPDRAREMGRLGRARAETHFDAKVYVARLEALVDQVLAGERPITESV